LAARRAGPHTEDPLAAARDRVVLAHRRYPAPAASIPGRSGDPRRHLLPVLVPAHRHRWPPRARLAMVRPGKEDRLATDPRPPTRPDDGRHRRRRRTTRGPGRHLAGREDPTLLLPHIS